MTLHGYKTFILCLVTLLGYFLCLLLEVGIDGSDLAFVLGGVTALYGVNDAAGALRDKARQPSVPDNVADVQADTVNVTPGGGR